MSYCIGYEQSCPDDDQCCPPDSWYNREYLDVIGTKGAQGLAEKKNRVALKLLTPQALNDLAWDMTGGEAPAGLSTAIARATTNFNATFPEQRWTTARRQSKVGCGAYDHPDDQGVYWPDARIAAIERLSGVTLDKATRAKLKKEGIYQPPIGIDMGGVPGVGSGRGTKLPNAMQGWIDMAGNALKLVPGNEPNRFVSDQPSIRAIFTSENGQLKPGSWLGYFLAIFDKQAGYQVGTGSAQRPNVATGGGRTVQASNVQPKSSSSAGSNGGSGGGFIGPLLLVAGLGFLLLKRK